MKYGVPHGHLFYHNQRSVYLLCHWVFKPQGHNFHLSAPKSTNKGGNLGPKDVTETQQRPESLMVILTWRASKCKVHKLHQRYSLKCFLLLLLLLWRCGLRSILDGVSPEEPRVFSVKGCLSHTVTGSIHQNQRRSASRSVVTATHQLHADAFPRPTKRTQRRRPGRRPAVG